jgi:hypothetical protein
MITLKRVEGKPKTEPKTEPNLTLKEFQREPPAEQMIGPRW